MSSLRRVARQASAELLLGFACCVIAFATAVYAHRFDAITWGVLFSAIAVEMQRRGLSLSGRAALGNLASRFGAVGLAYVLAPTVSGRRYLIDQFSSVNSFEFGCLYLLVLASWLAGIVAGLIGTRTATPSTGLVPGSESSAGEDRAGAGMSSNVLRSVSVIV